MPCQSEIEKALKEGFLKTDSDLTTKEGMTECQKIRRESNRRCTAKAKSCDFSSVSLCDRIQAYVNGWVPDARQGMPAMMKRMMMMIAVV